MHVQNLQQNEEVKRIFKEKLCNKNVDFSKVQSQQKPVAIFLFLVLKVREWVGHEYLRVIDRTEERKKFDSSYLSMLFWSSTFIGLFPVDWFLLLYSFFGISVKKKNKSSIFFTQRLDSNISLDEIFSFQSISFISSDAPILEKKKISHQIRDFVMHEKNRSNPFHIDPKIKSSKSIVSSLRYRGYRQP